MNDPDEIVRREYRHDDPPARRTDVFAETLGSMDGRADVRKTKPSTVLSVVPIPPTAQTFVVQTAQTPKGFYGFVQTMGVDGSSRTVLPPAVMNALYRQRESLVKQGRRERGRDRWANLSPDERSKAVTRLRKPRSA